MYDSWASLYPLVFRRQQTSQQKAEEEGVTWGMKQPHLSADVEWYPQRVSGPSLYWSELLFADGCADVNVYIIASPAAAAVAMVIHPDPVCSAVPSRSPSLSLSLSLPWRGFQFGKSIAEWPCLCAQRWPHILTVDSFTRWILIVSSTQSA